MVVSWIFLQHKLRQDAETHAAFHERDDGSVQHNAILWTGAEVVFMQIILDSPVIAPLGENQILPGKVFRNDESFVPWCKVWRHDAEQSIL